MARNCEQKDIIWMLELGRKMMLESRYKPLNFDAEKIGHLLLQLIRSPFGIVLRTDHGFLFGAVDSYWFGSDLYAFEYVFYVELEHRAGGEAEELIRGYVQAAKELGVDSPDIMIEHSTGVATEAVEHLFEKCGFVRVGGHFVLGEP